MSLSRLLILIIGLIITFGFAVWLVNSVYRLYIEIAIVSPPLAIVLVILLIVLIGVLIFAFSYYLVVPSLRRSRRKQRHRVGIRLPERKTEVAKETLQALRQQVGQIQDRVAQQAILARSQEIEANLARGELRVVVFGTGSAGKTSLVNALLGEIRGKVEATLGTTQIGQTYRLTLEGLQREILITDTPGILEAGVAGTEREQLARQLATEADLLLFVIDNDLQASEYKPLQALAEIGKRSLLILNKVDLYADEDREAILARLQERGQTLIPASDIVAIAASPQPVRIKGELVQPKPEIIPLIKRLVAVLRSEGEDLMADNILLQSQRLGEEAREMLDRQRRQHSDRIIDRYQWIGAGVIAVTPLPVVDMLATAAVNAQMVVEIGRIYGCELDSAKGRELALSLGRTLVSLGVVKGAVELLARALQFQVATYVVGKAIQGVTAAYLTRIAGKSFVEYFRHDQDWGDGGIAEVVQQQFQLNRRDEFIRAFVQEAIARVVKPLAFNAQDEGWAEEESNSHHRQDW